jgi:hypothetical protein
MLIGVLKSPGASIPNCLVPPAFREAAAIMQAVSTIMIIAFTSVFQRSFSDLALEACSAMTMTT